MRTDLVKPIERIAWAVDALSEELAIQARTADVLRALMQGRSVSIEPIYIHSAGLMRLPAEAFKGSLSELRPAIEKTLRDWLASLELPGLLPLTLLEHQDLSVRTKVSLLTTHAANSGADVIAASTTGKQGVDRFLLGSFAETLLLQSELPTLVVNPSSPPIRKIENILFPTDFGDLSSEAFQYIAALGAQLDAKVTIFHQAELIPLGLYRYISTESHLRYLDDSVAKLEQKALAWIQRAKQVGAEIDILIEKERGDVATGILKVADRIGANLIALVAEKGIVGAALLGSVTRKVLRASHCPVWTLRPSVLKPG